MEAVVSYFVGLEGKNEDEISDMLLVAPRLDESMMRVPEILELFYRGLHAPSAEVRRFVLRSFLKHMPVDQLPERLWSACVLLLGDSNLGVAQTAGQVAVAFATSERLAAAEEVLARVETQSSECSLRVLQVAVDVVVQKKTQSLSSVHKRIVSALLRADEEGDTDPLFAVATLEQLATCASAAPQVVYEDTGLSERAAKKVRAALENGGGSSLLAAAWLRLLGSCVVAGGQNAFLTFLKDGQDGALQWAMRVLDGQSSKDVSVSEALLDGALVVMEGVVIGSEEGCAQMSAAVMRKVLLLASNPSEQTQVRVRCLSFVADVLEALNPQRPFKRHTTAAVASVVLSADSRRKIVALVEETTGLVARLLSMAQQPLLEDQREAVYRVLTSLIRETPQWTFQTAPSLAAFITGKMGAQGLDISKDTLHWRFRMAQEAFNHGRDALIQMVGDERTIEIITYLRGGMYGGSANEAKADVADQFAN